VDYSFFIMVEVLVMSERLEKRLRMPPVAFPPQIFAGSTSILCFRVSTPPPHENASGSLFIGVLGQARQSEIKTNDIRGSRYKRARVVRPRLGPAPPVIVWALLALSCASSSHALYPRKIITPKKSCSCLSFKRSLKLENTEKNEFPVLQSYKSNKGDRWKIPVNQHKT
jgi:hypothetical protein